MLKLIYDSYQKEYKYLENKINYYYIQNDTFYLRNFYQETIVSIYGLYEGTVNKLILNYLREINYTFKKYSDIPKNLRIQHEKLSYEFITDFEKGKYKNLLNSKTIFKNLADCFSDKENYRLNVEAFVANTSNCYLEQLDKNLKLIDIHNFFNSCELTKKFGICFDENEQEEKFKSKYIKDLLPNINLLVKERNKCAHNEAPSEILGEATLLHILKTIDLIIENLYVILKKNYTLLIFNKYKPKHYAKPDVYELKDITIKNYESELLVEINSKFYIKRLEEIRIFRGSEKPIIINKFPYEYIGENKYDISIKFFETNSKNKIDYIYLKKL